MKFLLIIWLYQSNIYYEIKYSSMAKCHEYEIIAHTWNTPVITQCMKNIVSHKETHLK